uniref:DUF1640 domain-containing protein n=1 Tax=Candidatus Kentrum sp. TUN TaxID=2126343 RepID=A0A451AAU0_9GAMM|nr:MAG: hypothetical protein BECKTUN1418F_GA0071002_10158 [Candidatus Kentron sp. TUN]VFK63152.1 MAG: hypothetical protein BECKTUN1418D_GA0071000_11997 [Candidatus Kentron sp. TUN]
MSFENAQLEEIGGYVRTHLADWLAENSLVKPPVVYEIDLRERMVRVEEELRHQRELMKQGFDLMEKRFEQVEKRFEQVDKRFEDMNKRFEAVDKRFDMLVKRIDRFMIWSFGMTISSVLVVVSVIEIL